jgi:hypothetical protein
VVNTVLLRPLSYPEPDRIVVLVRARPPWAPGIWLGINPAEFPVVREQTQAFNGIAALDNVVAGVNLTGGTTRSNLEVFVSQRATSACSARQWQSAERFPLRRIAPAAPGWP